MRMGFVAGAATLALAACSGSHVPVRPTATKPSAAMALPAPAAGEAELAAALNQRASDLVKLLNGELAPVQVFDPAFLARLPAEKLTGLARTVTVRYGRATGVERVEITEPNRARAFINFEEGQVPVTIVVNPKSPHLLLGLLLK